MLDAFCCCPPPRRYSFRVPPQLELKVRPKLGEREVTFLHVTEWIEKKLQHEFQVPVPKGWVCYRAEQTLLVCFLLLTLEISAQRTKGSP